MKYKQIKRKTSYWVTMNTEVIPAVPVKVLVGDDGCVQSDNGVWCHNCGESLTGAEEYLCKGVYCPTCGAKMEKERRK